MHILMVNLRKLNFVLLFFEEPCRFVHPTATHEITIITSKYL